MVELPAPSEVAVVVARHGVPLRLSSAAVPLNMSTSGLRASICRGTDPAKRPHTSTQSSWVQEVDGGADDDDDPVEFVVKSLQASAPVITPPPPPLDIGGGDSGSG